MAKTIIGPKYEWVDDHRRQELIRRVTAGSKIVDAARDLSINYGNAKGIMKNHRIKLLKHPGTIARECRKPKFHKIFRVERPKRKMLRYRTNRVQRTQNVSSSTLQTLTTCDQSPVVSDFTFCKLGCNDGVNSETGKTDESQFLFPIARKLRTSKDENARWVDTKTKQSLVNTIFGEPSPTLSDGEPAQSGLPIKISFINRGEIAYINHGRLVHLPHPQTPPLDIE